MELSKQPNLNRLKAMELDILKETIEICRMLNIKYYVMYGTLLGAVRHGGFIPWDDDIDIAMLREDYNVFLSEAPKYLSGHLFLQTHETDPEYLQGFAKIRNSNTTFAEKTYRPVRMNQGIFIDIFPLDYTSRKHDALYRMRKFVLDERIYTDFQSQGASSAVSRLALAYAKFRYPSLEKAFQKREELYRLPNGKRYLANHTSGWETKETAPAEWFEEGTVLSFEGMPVLAPKEYDKLLRQEYGDYWQLPPVEQRVTQHETLLIDLDNSYRNYDLSQE